MSVNANMQATKNFKHNKSNIYLSVSNALIMVKRINCRFVEKFTNKLG